MEKLAAKIESEIRNHGAIPFARFMELALYCPVYGYYEKEGDIIGREGDYYTSVSVGSLFGHLLAWQFCDWFAAVADAGGAPCPRIGSQGPARLRLVEAGAHRGALAHDVLAWFRAHRPEVLERLDYWILEPSPVRRAWQQQTLAAFERNIHWARQFSQLSRSPAGGSSVPAYTIIFANELLDAMPAHRLGWDATNRAWFEWGVTARSGRFAWTRIPIPTGDAVCAAEPAPSLLQLQPPTRILERLLDSLARSDVEGGAASADSRRAATRLLELLPDGFTIEISPAAEAWWRTAAGTLRTGRLVAIDYGHPFEKLLTPERAAGTLRAYRRHSPAPDPLDAPGHQDITADVNFTLLQHAAESAGLKTELFVRQSKFLTDIAARIWRTERSFESWSPQDRRQFHTLTHPDHLGRAFHVLVQSSREPQK